MKRDQFTSASTATVIKAPAAVTADANGAGVDISNYSGLVMLLAAIFNTAGSSPTLAAKYQTSTDGDYVGEISYIGTGTGNLTELASGPDTVAEDFTITFSSATSAAVVGSVSGSLGTATVGTKFTSTKISFLLTAGSTAFVNTDAFAVSTTAQAYTDIAGATIANPGSTSTIVRTVVDSDKLGRFIRPVFDIGGTNSPSYTIGITAYGMVNG